MTSSKEFGNHHSSFKAPKLRPVAVVESHKWYSAQDLSEANLRRELLKDATQQFVEDAGMSISRKDILEIMGGNEEGPEVKVGKRFGWPIFDKQHGDYEGTSREIPAVDPDF